MRKMHGWNLNYNYHTFSNKIFPNTALKRQPPKKNWVHAVSFFCLLTHSQRNMKFLPVKKKPRTLTHPQQLKQNHNNMTGTTRWPHFSPCNPTNPFIFSPADSVFKDDNSQLSSARTFNSSHTATDCRYDSSGSSQAWSMKSLLAILPDSPSPVCSSCPSPSTPSSFFPSSDAFSSRMSTELSTQRNKVLRQENGCLFLGFVYLEVWINGSVCVLFIMHSVDNLNKKICISWYFDGADFRSYNHFLIYWGF